ncbi:hypothetical protein CLAFUW4_06980 [Fulvia fulva]|uniref:F-box domain-containing protein n=1 Tax=Passalora fulva TaxID=5499 RepID=A0A9Q8UQ70_PASFU|nr:uncharacterized protein CLAFUR5_07116 [Fulvia fulva]KAK4621254.1 hypothetical protein CLAFUR4_06989 [Fulvia fulva]KAK4622979.1 hypothetical protein CLAFUR0_06987 [Fulvia fulva]UJO18593.1 hypothetical protein CLAFUR5_07116 [Fulvia fulva]WPV15753.1 hypothetical protein CLAFUW4_06980 [Fulvia fulva]WPV31025.1 hypothetical protein CLAFUW7_06980 [Fulvia fulva]
MAEIVPVKPFRLLDLPDELWAKIGKLALDDIEPLCSEYLDYLVYDDDDKVQIPQKPAITRTCKALRHELLPLYYEQKIDLDLRESRFWLWGSLTRRWLQAIGATNRKAIRGMSLVSSDWDIDYLNKELRLRWGVGLKLEITWELDHRRGYRIEVCS